MSNHRRPPNRENTHPTPTYAYTWISQNLYQDPSRWNTRMRTGTKLLTTSTYRFAAENVMSMAICLEISHWTPQPPSPLIQSRRMASPMSLEGEKTPLKSRTRIRPQRTHPRILLKLWARNRKKRRPKTPFKLPCRQKERALKIHVAPIRRK